ncbi:hypothetical protein R9X47_03150 [Wukongibacter baidiensis]|uniref:hypothetical protein n=1 Tax=Wukongibacter baidiensis TaxID=1723361 RepID=UPI003D7FB65A
MSDNIWEAEYDTRRYWSRKIEDLCKEKNMEIPDMENKFANKLESIYLGMINHDN